MPGQGRMDAGLAAGFADPAQDSAAVFRAALDAIARPGRIGQVSGLCAPAGLSTGAAALLLALADAETPVWLPEPLLSGAAGSWLRFQTGAPLAPERAGVRFAAGPWEALMPLGGWDAGDPSYPDRSAILIVEVPSLAGGTPLCLTGPGIAGQCVFAPVLPDGAAEILRANRAGFPLGLDFFFTAGEGLAALPRSTRIGG